MAHSYLQDVHAAREERYCSHEGRAQTFIGICLGLGSRYILSKCGGSLYLKKGRGRVCVLRPGDWTRLLDRDLTVLPLFLLKTQATLSHIPSACLSAFRGQVHLNIPEFHPGRRGFSIASLHPPESVPGSTANQQNLGLWPPPSAPALPSPTWSPATTPTGLQPQWTLRYTHTHTYPPPRLP